MERILIALFTLFFGTHSMSSADNTLKILVSVGGEIPFSETVPAEIKDIFSDAVFGAWTLPAANGDYKSEIIDFEFESPKTIVLKIKANSKFSNSREIKAVDLEFSILRGLFSKYSDFYKGFLGNIVGVDRADFSNGFKTGLVSGIKALDQKTIKLQLIRPGKEILNTLNLPYLSPRPIEEMNPDYESWKDLPVGAGPYKLVRADSRSGVYEMVASEGHKVKFKMIELHTKDHGIPYDLIVGRDLDAKEKNYYEVVYSKTPSSVYSLFLSNSFSALSDPKIRKLLSRAIDRTKLADPTAITAHFFPKNQISLPDQGEIESSRKKVRDSLKTISNETLKIPVFGSTLSESQKALFSELKTQFLTMGLNTDFYPDPKKFLDKEDATKHPFTAASLIVNPVSPYRLFRTFHGSSMDTFNNHPNDKKLNQLFEELSSAMGTSKEGTVSQEIESHIAEMGYGIPLFYKKLRISLKKTLNANLGELNDSLSINWYEIK
jgi:ABC-type transport system substrate-binding protein